MTKDQGQTPVFGLLNLNKPLGVTSRDVVNQVQKLIRPVKVGHAGTLDPLATGVLVLCVGKATRLISCVQDRLKTYRGTFELGKTSDTDDLEGTITATPDFADVVREQVEALLPEFIGLIEQVPPVFSAVHVDGRRAYDLARRGHGVELPPREVFVASIELIEWNFPQLVLEITCGTGTYIRSLGRDIGERLGCGAVMTGLVRTKSGDFSIEQAVDPDSLTKDNIADHLQPAKLAVGHLPSIVCKVVERNLLISGRGIHRKPEEDGSIAIFDGQGELVCLAEWDERKELLMPKLVFAEPAESKSGDTPEA